MRAELADLTGNASVEMDGNREKMVGKIQEKYAVAKDEAETQLDEWSKNHRAPARPPRASRSGGLCQRDRPQRLRKPYRRLSWILPAY